MSVESARHNRISPLPWQIALVAAGYFLTGWLGLSVPFVGSNITLIWAPTGIAVAALWCWGRGGLAGDRVGGAGGKLQGEFSLDSGTRSQRGKYAGADVDLVAATAAEIFAAI
jgi:hypothetical protein